jgi:hypothetical protein
MPFPFSATVEKFHLAVTMVKAPVTGGWYDMKRTALSDARCNQRGGSVWG